MPNTQLSLSHTVQSPWIFKLRCCRQHRGNSRYTRHPAQWARGIGWRHSGVPEGCKGPGAAAVDTPPTEPQDTNRHALTSRNWVPVKMHHSNCRTLTSCQLWSGRVTIHGRTTGVQVLGTETRDRVQVSEWLLRLLWPVSQSDNDPAQLWNRFNAL